MKFNEMPYSRPDYEATALQINQYCDKLEQAGAATEFLPVFRQLNQVRAHVQTQATLASIRHTINTKDEFYDRENDYWDNTMPLYSALNDRLYKITLAKEYREDLLHEIPETFFQLAQCAVDSFDEKIIEDLQTENNLASQYGKLLASAEIEVDGKIYNLTSIGALTESKDRSLRERSMKAMMNFFNEHETEIDEIYDKMVQVRTQMAKKLGYDNYVELGYKRMNRLDYDSTMVQTFRKQVLEQIVPLASSLVERQKKRLHLDTLRYYDLNYEFESGNPTPKGTPEELVAIAHQMYREMASETGEFFDVMVENELFDLVSKPGKEGGGYCTDILEYRVPFIFSNFNGTSGDIDVLTHEAGHAFQSYVTMKQENIVPECAFPTMESAEIDSMSMEFFAYPWIENFCKEDTMKYKFNHLSHAIKFIPYGVLVDAFQHEIYEHPEMSKEERKKTWRKLEKLYTPWKNYDGCEILEKGCWWYRQSHIFSSPFYYIDYTLAQLCALQFYSRQVDRDPEAWNDYVALCKLGGSKPFLKLLEVAHLKSPFEEGTVASIMNNIETALNQIDDTKL